MGKQCEVGIIGAGMMGAEIALCFAISGYRVVMKETTLELARKGQERLAGILDKAIEKGKFQAEDKEATLGRIIPADQYDLFRHVDIVLEAVVEDFAVKKSVFQELEMVCKPSCIFASNTSSIPITRLAACLHSERTKQFVGAHFFSPASVMKLVEVIPGLETSEEAASHLIDYCHRIGKTPIRIKDVTGFVVNRILHAMWIEANRLLEEGVATPEDIDKACKLGLGHPIGPYALMDLTGNDLNLRVQEILFDTYGERFLPRPVLRQKVDANHIGRKTGRGWFEYDK